MSNLKQNACMSSSLHGHHITVAPLSPLCHHGHHMIIIIIASKWHCFHHMAIGISIVFITWPSHDDHRIIIVPSLHHHHHWLVFVYTGVATSQCSTNSSVHWRASIGWQHSSATHYLALSFLCQQSQTLPTTWRWCSVKPSGMMGGCCLAMWWKRRSSWVSQVE